MANKVLIKRSGTANNSPELSDLSVGEIAINYADGKLFTRKGDDSENDTVITLAEDLDSESFADRIREITGIADTFEPIGFPARLDSTIAFDNSTRTFSITPVGASFDVWCKGKKYSYTSAQSLQIGSSTGIYYIYFDPQGGLQYRLSYFDWENDTPTAYIYWNSTTSTAIYFADERHGVTLDWATHEYLHRTRGAVLASGFSVSNYTITGDGTSDAHAQIDLSGGTFFDEDLQIDITHSNSPTANTWEQDLQGPARIPVLYLNGTSWEISSPTDFPLKQGTVRPQYNLLTAGSWSTVDIDSGKFVNYYIIATNNVNYPVLSIIGQEQFNNIGQAEQKSFSNLTLSGFPVFEFRPLYKLIFQSDGYTNTPHAVIRGVYDLRGLQSAGIAASVVSDHGLLSGTGDDDHTQYLHTTDSRTGITANIHTSGTIKTTNATESTSSTTGALVVTGGAGIGGNLFVGGDLTISGTTTTLSTQTIVVEDSNIQLGTVESPSNITAHLGGITLLAGEGGDKTIKWVSTTGAWTFSEHVDIANGKEYYIAGSSVLSATALGNGVTSSSLTSVGTIATGTWNGTAVGVAYGGTGLTTVAKGSVLVSNDGTTVAALDGDGSTDKILVYNHGTDTVSWSTDLDGGSY